jgi:hypothetical protein
MTIVYIPGMPPPTMHVTIVCTMHVMVTLYTQPGDQPPPQHQIELKTNQFLNRNHAILFQEVV